MRRFRIVFCREFKETLRSKPFIVISVFFLIILLLIGAVCLFFGVLSGDSSSSELIDTDSMIEQIISGDGATASVEVEPDFSAVFGVTDRSGEDVVSRLQEAFPFYRFDRLDLDDDAIAEALENGDCDGYVIIDSPMSFEYREKSSLYSEDYAGQFSDALARIHRLELLADKGVSGSDAAEILDSAPDWFVTYIGGYDTGKYIYNTLMVILMFLAIALYGQMVSTRVATEKTSRTMEVLATSVTPRELLWGKVLGVGAAGLLQILAFVMIFFGMMKAAVSTSPVIGDMLSGMISIMPLDTVYLCLYFLLGFLLMAFIYGGLGSMVSQVEDLSGIVSLPLYIFMIGYLIGIFSSSFGEPTMLLRVASFVPFWSPVTMFCRMTLETVPHWQVLLSLLLLSATVVLTAAASARIYRTGMLRYGKPPRLREILDALKK